MGMELPIDETELVNVKPLHREILRALSTGARVGDIARQFNISRRTVSRVRHSEVGRRWLTQFNRETDRLAARMAAAQTFALFNNLR